MKMHQQVAPPPPPPPGDTESADVDVRDTSGYRAVAAANILTFLAFRVLVFIWLGLKLTVIRDTVTTAVYFMFWAGLIVVAVISFVHFRRLIMTDFFSPRLRPADDMKTKTS